MMSRTSRSYIIPEARPQARVRVLCFHHAGGSALSFAPFGRHLPPECELCLFELPGRGLTPGEPFLPTFSAAKAYFLKGVSELVDRPVIFLGHSLGGLLAHALACALPFEKRHLVRRVIISSACSVQTAASRARHPRAPFVIRSRASLLNDLLRLGGTPQEILQDAELLEQTIRLLGHDFHLLDTYSAEYGDDADRTPVRSPRFPLEIWYGRDDPAVTPKEVALWAEATSTPVQERVFDGDHFYLFKNCAPAAVLNTLLLADRLSEASSIERWRSA